MSLRKGNVAQLREIERIFQIFVKIEKHFQN